MGKFTVTQGQYKDVSGKSPSQFKGATLPVECIGPEDSAQFCRKLTETFKAQLAPREAFMLPNEIQWQYACRAGTTTRYHVGDTISTDDANFKGTWNPKHVRGA